MSVQVTIELPDGLAQGAKEVAEKFGLQLEDVILTWIDRGRQSDETPDGRKALIRRKNELAHEAWVAGLKKALQESGATGEPIGAERLRQMMIEDGVDPNDNSFSRGIIEMREE